MYNRGVYCKDRTRRIRKSHIINLRRADSKHEVTLKIFIFIITSILLMIKTKTMAGNNRFVVSSINYKIIQSNFSTVPIENN